MLWLSTNTDEALGLLSKLPQCGGDCYLHWTWCSGSEGSVLKQTPGNRLCSFGSPILRRAQRQPCLSVVLASRRCSVIGSDCSSRWHPPFQTTQTSQQFKTESFPFSVGTAVCLCSWNEGKLFRKNLCRSETMQRESFHLAGFFYLPSSFPPIICLRHHSLHPGRHSLHQAWVNISQVSAWICIFLLPATTFGHSCTFTHTHT